MNAFTPCVTALFAICCSCGVLAREKDESIRAREYGGAVACVMNANGNKHPVIQKTSGYRQLDHAALAAAEFWCQVERFRQMPVPDATQANPSRAS